MHTCPTHDPATNRRSGGTILAVRRDTYKDANVISPPPHIEEYKSAAKLTPQDGSPIITISAYMPQHRTKAQDTIHAKILTWIHTEIIYKFPTVTTLMGGNLQVTPNEEDERSYNATLSQFCQESGLKHITPKDTHTYIPAQTSLDHWLLRQPTTTTHYTNINTKITTHTPEYGDHKALILNLPQIGIIKTHDHKHSQQNPTTRSHPPFQLPTPRNLIDLYQLGNPSTSANINHTS